MGNDIQIVSPPGIYIHVPFCVQKCLYCDFYSVTDATLHAPFVDAVIREMGTAESFPAPPDTLYFGGGTPSVLGPERIARLVKAAAEKFSLPSHAEITLEVNPGTVTLKDLSAYRAAGINRLNIGIQSFRDEVLTFLGRCHSSGEARRALGNARQAGFSNVGLDLIYGIPGQTVCSWQETLAEGLSFQPEHLSCYLLTYESGTPLDRLRASGKVRPMEEDLGAELFGVTQDVLAASGYEQYEISNFARTPEFRSRHNQKYWDHTPYLGFGPAAHSFVSGRRRWNLKDVAGYIDLMGKGLSPVEEEETLTSSQVMMETIYLGFRTCDGIPLKKFKARFGRALNDVFPDLIEHLAEEKLLDLTDDRCALTREGLRFHDHIVSRFVAEID